MTRISLGLMSAHWMCIYTAMLDAWAFYDKGIVCESNRTTPRFCFSVFYVLRVLRIHRAAPQSLLRGHPQDRAVSQHHPEGDPFCLKARARKKKTSKPELPTCFTRPTMQPSFTSSLYPFCIFSAQGRSTNSIWGTEVSMSTEFSRTPLHCVDRPFDAASLERFNT